MTWRQIGLVSTALGGLLLGPAPGCHGRPVGDRPQENTAGSAVLGPLDAVERSRLRESAIQALLDMVASEDAQVRANALEGLIPAASRLEAVLPAALADDNVGVRSVAAVAVGRGKIRGVLDAVRPLVHDASPFVRAAAIFALRANGEEVDPSPLGAMVTTDPSSQVRAQAAFLLGELRDKGTSSLLRDAAEQDVPQANAIEEKLLQVQIAEALVKLGDAEQLHTIRAALYPSTPEELDATVVAIQILGGLKDRGSLGQLRTVASMRDPAGNPLPVEVRLAAAGALGDLGSGELESLAAGVFAKGSDPQRMQAAWALGRIASPGAVRLLHGSLGEPTERVRVAIAAALLTAIERNGSS